MSLEEKLQWATRFLDKHYKDFVDAEILFEKRIEACLQEDTVVLDAGCGKGELLEKLSPEVRFAVGVDVSERSLRIALCNQDSSIKQPPGLLLGNLESLPFKDETFDLITCRWVIEHLKDPKRTFCEFQRILKKGGRVIILTPNAYNYVMILSRFMPPGAKKRMLRKLGRSELDTFPTYYRCNSVSRLQVTAKESGFIKENLVLVGNPFYLFFSKLFFRLAVVYEKLTDITALKGGKIHIVASFVKQ